MAGALAPAALASASGPGESLRGRGIVAGTALYLFGEVHACGEAPALPAAQIYVSTDQGATWEKRGPALAGSELLFAREDRGTLWAAGEHTAEGPAIDPFYLVPTSRPAAFTWTVRTIREGPAELLGASGGRRALSASLRPTDAHGGPLPGGAVRYRSRDGGRSWRREDGASGPPSLARITTRSGRWRIVDRRDGGFDVQRAAARGWALGKEFPWAACPAR